MQFDFNLSGAGVIAEGPMKKGAWFLSARRSYLDVIIKEILKEVSSIPIFGDFQSKLAYDLSPKHKITLLEIFGFDGIDILKDDANANYYGDNRTRQNTAGANWQFLWGNKGFSNTSISHTLTKFDLNWLQTRSDSVYFDNDSREQEWRLQNVNYYRLHPAHKLEFGVEAKFLETRYDNFFAEYDDLLGNRPPAFRFDKNISAMKLASFASYNWKPLPRLTLTPGVRVDYFDYNTNTLVSPRFSFSYQLTPLTSINDATGVFYQNLPMILLAQNPANKKLRDPSAQHYVLGIHHLITENTRLTIEAYEKRYDHLPLDPAQPSLFIIDQSVYQEYFLNHERLVDNGKASARGVEVTLQKKLAKDLYGMAGASYSAISFIETAGGSALSFQQFKFDRLSRRVECLRAEKHLSLSLE